MRNRLRLVLMATLATALSGCGGSTPGSPSSSSSTIAGRWVGTITVTPDRQAPVTVATEWTLTETGLTAGHIYQAAITASNWFPQQFAGTVTAIPMSADSYSASTTGFYASPRVCQGSYYSQTTVTPQTLSGSFYGVDCAGIQFNGSVSLTK